MDEDKTKKRRAIFLVLLFVIPGIVLLWVPWMGDKEIHDWIMKDKAKIDGTIDMKTGEIVCDYTVSWAPFGRWVASCEGGPYFVTFYGQII